MESKKIQSQIEQLKQNRLDSLKSFSEIAHRMQTVAVKNGVEWVNDSKATDVDTTYLSLEMINKPTVWIVGSAEEFQDYTVLDKLVKYKVKSIICFGKPETTIKYRFASWVDMYAHKETLEDAIWCAQKWSESGDAVLFSPATPGFEMFGDFRNRGEAFTSIVSNL
jgi:UDP-N-acetylmuramoylalanine--D-glutamate ligase